MPLYLIKVLFWTPHSKWGMGCWNSTPHVVWWSANLSDWSSHIFLLQKPSCHPGMSRVQYRYQMVWTEIERMVVTLGNCSHSKQSHWIVWIVLEGWHWVDPMDMSCILWKQLSQWMEHCLECHQGNKWEQCWVSCQMQTCSWYKHFGTYQQLL